MNPVIVINAYNRPASLQRLLTSLKLSKLEAGIDIVFSLEYDAHADVAAQVKNFEWSYGEKTIIQQPSRQGLIGHFMFCGSLTEKYGTIIYLEDDLFLGPDFYVYAKKILAVYGEEERLAGFSLNALWFNGYLHLPFKPIEDGNPNFFLQVPWYQGQIYTPAQWAHFKNWYNNYKGVNHALQIHPIFNNYQLTDDWFPVKTQYLIEMGKYYCFPRAAQCVNFGDAGTHFKNNTNFFQTELSLGVNTHATYTSFDESIAVYDSFFELLPERLKRLAPHMATVDVELDLHGTKDFKKMQAEYVLTPVAAASAVATYGYEMRPQELNIVYNVPGNHFHLARVKDVVDSPRSTAHFYTQFFYHNRFKLTWKQRFNIFLKK